MKIGILSDSHNNVTNIQTALTAFRQEGIETIIHCGDLTSKETAATLGGFRVIHTFGNGDADRATLRQTLKELNPDNFSETVYTGEIDGVKIAATHSHLPGKLEALIDSGLYRYVFFGHSHHFYDEMVGRSRVINPGPVGHRGDFSAVILDLKNDTCQKIKL